MKKSNGINEKKGPMTEGQKEKCKCMLIAVRNIYKRLLSDTCAGEEDYQDYKEVIEELQEQIQDPKKYYGDYEACKAMFMQDLEGFSSLIRCGHIINDELDYILGNQTIIEYVFGRND